MDKKEELAKELFEYLTGYSYDEYEQSPTLDDVQACDLLKKIVALLEIEQMITLDVIQTARRSVKITPIGRKEAAR